MATSGIAHGICPRSPALSPSTAAPRALLVSAAPAGPPRALSFDAARLIAPPPSRKPWAARATADALAAEVPEPVEEQVASVITSEDPKTEDVFAVIMIGSRQYIVFPGRFLRTQRLKGANVNDKIVLNKVLLVATKTNAYIGQPIVQNAVVHAVVEEQGLDPKVIVFKYKKKKNYKRTIGHRQPNTRIRITAITGYEDAPADPMPV